MQRKRCTVDSKCFCYVCGCYMLGKRGKIITNALKDAYLQYFGFAVVNTDKPWVPKLFCNACRTKLYKWSLGENMYFSFSVPTLWREQKNHVDDCYFCSMNVVGINAKKLARYEYPDVSSVSKPVPRTDSDPFVKALNREGPAFQYLIKLFPKLSYAKIKEGIFVGPDIRKVMADAKFTKCLTPDEAAAWASFKNVVHNFLGNHKSPDYKQVIDNFLKNYHKIGARMSLKIHFLHSHLDFFPQNLGDTSDEQGERLHQDIAKIERRYQGFWDEGMMSDYCWTLKRETDPKKYKRLSSTSVHF